MPAWLPSMPSLCTAPRASQGPKKQVPNEWTNDRTSDWGRTVHVTNAIHDEPRGAVPEHLGRAGPPHEFSSKRVQDTYCVPGLRAQG